MCSCLLCDDIPHMGVCQCAGRTDVIQIAWRASTAVLDTWPAQERVGRILSSENDSQTESTGTDPKHTVANKQPNLSGQ